MVRPEMKMFGFNWIKMSTLPTSFYHIQNSSCLHRMKISNCIIKTDTNMQPGMYASILNRLNRASMDGRTIQMQVLNNSERSGWNREMLDRESDVLGRARSLRRLQNDTGANSVLTASDQSRIVWWGPGPAGRVGEYTGTHWVSGWGPGPAGCVGGGP